MEVLSLLLPFLSVLLLQSCGLSMQPRSPQEQRSIWTVRELAQGQAGSRGVGRSFTPLQKLLQGGAEQSPGNNSMFLQQHNRTGKLHSRLLSLARSYRAQNGFLLFVTPLGGDKFTQTFTVSIQPLCVGKGCASPCPCPWPWTEPDDP